MRILYVSYFYPPYNVIGAVRAGKAVKYLQRFGHELHVLTAADQPYQTSLDSELDEDHIHRTPWKYLGKPRRLERAEQNQAAAPAVAARDSWKNKLMKKAWNGYRAVVHVPDPFIGWMSYAMQAGRPLCRDWSPDLIFASAQPYTSLWIAQRLSRETGIPWVAELRDLWTENHYYDFPRWRKVLERRLERKVLSTASGMVTVTQGLHTRLKEQYGLPIALVRNGFDHEDVPVEEAPPTSRDTLRVVYTGAIYPGKRDPSVLFQSLRLLGEQARQVKICFYGRRMGDVQQLADAAGVSEHVEIHHPVSYQESLQLQREADLLLLLLWDHPAENAVLPGKLYEYFGARRPILGVGPVDSESGCLVAERRAGLVSTDPEALAAELRTRLEEKQREGRLPALPVEATRGLTREDQNRWLDEFLRTVVPGA